MGKRAYRKTEPECPCKKCKCYKSADALLRKSRAKQRCERFENEREETCRVYDDISAGGGSAGSFNVRPLGPEDDEQVIARLAKALIDPEPWVMETLTAGGSYVPAPDRARESIAAILPTMPRREEIAVPAGAEARVDAGMLSDDSLGGYGDSDEE